MRSPFFAGDPRLLLVLLHNVLQFVLGGTITEQLVKFIATVGFNVFQNLRHNQTPDSDGTSTAFFGR